MSREKIFTRYTEKEFFGLVDYFINERYPKVDISKFEGEAYKEVSKWKWELDCIKPDINNEKVMFTIRLLKLRIISATMEDWKNWSLEQQNAASIIFKLLMNRIFDIHNVCQTFICSVNDNLSEQMIDDIVFINSELFDFEYWDEYHVAAISSIIAKAPKYNAIDDLMLLLNDPMISDKYKGNVRKLIDEANKDLKNRIDKINHDIKHSRNLIIKNDKGIRVAEQELEVYQNFEFDLDAENLVMTKLKSELERLIESVEKYCPGFDEAWWGLIKIEFKEIDNKYKSKNVTGEDYVKLLNDKYNYIMSLGDMIRKRIVEYKDRTKHLYSSISRNEKLLNIVSNKGVNIVLYDGLDWKAIETHQTLSVKFKNKYLELFKAPSYEINDSELIGAGASGYSNGKNKGGRGKKKQ